METTIIKTYETPNGIKVEVKGELVLEKQVNLDGQLGTVSACEIKLNVFANGKSQGSWIRELTAVQKSKLPAVCTHVVGQLPLTSEHVEIIKSVRAELEQHPAWIENQEKIAREQAARGEYNETLKNIELQEGV
jgi:hypothetical protein